MSRTGIPPLPAPTWRMWAITSILRVAATRSGALLRGSAPQGERSSGGALHCASRLHAWLLRLGQRPFAGLVPDFVARQPAPRRLNREHTGELRRVPSTRRTGAA